MACQSYDWMLGVLHGIPCHELLVVLGPGERKAINLSYLDINAIMWFPLAFQVQFLYFI